MEIITEQDGEKKYVNSFILVKEIKITLSEHRYQLFLFTHFSDVLRKRDIRLTRISIVIVFVFIICHVPRMIPNITEMANHEFLTKVSILNTNTIEW